ncbi:protease HtpX, partial [Candidatus Vampirococcus lugosii]
PETNISGYGYDFVGVGIFSLIVGFSGAFISLLISKWVAKWMYSPQIINPENLSQFGEKEIFVYQVVERLASRGNIKTPEVGIYASNEPNAFATGPTKNNSLVAVSSGLIYNMDFDAIEGVVAHEMAHILNGDMVTMTLLQGVMNTFVVFLSRIIGTFVDKAVFKNEDGPGLGYFLVSFVLQILLSILASIVLAWFSRYREFKADAGSADLVGKEKMIAGLQQLQVLVQNIEFEDNQATNSMKIVSGASIMKLFSSHPPLEKRIQALQSK